jgi:predicted transcriptional regulator
MAEIISVVVDEATNARLDAISKVRDCSVTSIAAEAISAFAGLEENHIDAIRRGIDDLDSGREVPHERVEAWLRS